MNVKMRVFVLMAIALLMANILPANITFSPANPSPGQAVKFTLNPTHANMMADNQITWVFADGTQLLRPVTQLSVSHAYAAPGDYEVSVRYYYRDALGMPQYFSENTLVRVTAAAKSLTFSPANPNTCQPVTFKAAGFTSMTLRWDFGDGTVKAGMGAVVDHAFSSPGSFMVRAFDNNGRDADPATKPVVVGNKRSVTLLTPQPKTGIPVSFKAAGFIAPCLLWDFGDGQPRVKGTAAASHVFANPGLFQVTVRDNCGESACAAGISAAVGASQAPPAPFAISLGVLRFANGKTSISMVQNTPGLTAFADLKFAGSGLLQAEWRVDGQPFKTTTQSLGPAGQVTIDSGMVPGLPTTAPGSHTVSLAIIQPAGGFAVQPISYYVTGAPEPMSMPQSVNPQAPIVQAVIPASLVQGKAYVLDLQGVRLTPDTVISLGAGIAVNSFTLINPMRASLAIFVSAAAQPGDRFAKAGNSKGSNTGPGKLVVAAAPPKPPMQMADLACTDLSTMVIEPIELKAPRWRTDAHETIVTYQGSDGKTATIPWAEAELCMPVLDDLMVLRWESLPVYDFLEVRFFKASDNTLLMTKKIAGSSQSLPLSGAVIVELFSHIPAATDQLSAQTQYAPGSGVQNNTAMVNTSGMTPEEIQEFKNKQLYDQAMKKADIFWQVVGFSTFPCVFDSKKDAPSQINQSIVVAQSELWMFQLPDRPNGLACPAGSGMRKGSAHINIANQTKADRNTNPNLPKNSESTIDYVGDEFVASGSFDLARSPYGSTIIANANPSIPNLFIDWGDGTPSSTLDVQIAASQKDRWDKSVKVQIKPSARSRHVYLKAGSQYTIRIFELSENDIQTPVSGFLAKLGKVLKPKESAPATGDPGVPFYVLLEQQGGNGSQASGTGYESFTDKLGRAYMIFCKTVAIQPYRDTCVDQPISLAGIEIVDFPGHSLMIKTNGQKPPGGINLKQGQAKDYADKGIDAVAVTCDTALKAEAELTYFGTGFVELTWRVDGQVVEKRTLPKLKSEERANLSLEQAMDCNSPRLSHENRVSAPLPVQGPEKNSMLGIHTVTVEARVVSEYSVSNLGNVAVQSVENMLAKAGVFSKGEPAEKGPYASPDPDGAPSDPLLAAMSQAQNSNQSMPQVGFLNPDNTADGNPAVVYLNDSLAAQAAEGALDSPNRVFSQAKRYQVNEVRNQLGCLVLVPDNKGEYFHLTDMGGSILLDEANETYSASGILHIWCPMGNGSVAEATVPGVQFSNWSIADETGILTNGILDVSPKGVTDFQFPAFIHKATLTRLQGGVDGNVKRPMMATFDFDLPMNGLKQISSLGGNTNASIKQATGQLAASSGDWYAAGLKLGSSQFGFTPFSIVSNNVAIDLSAHENPAAITKANNWMGVHLGSAEITPYTMGFSPDSNQFAMQTTEEWVITSGGLNGKAKSAPFKSTIELGSFAFDDVEFSVTNDAPKGIYHGVKIFAPWLAATLTGDAVLKAQSNGKEFITVLTLDDHPPVVRTYSDLGQQGKLTMTASDFSFMSATAVDSSLPAVECRMVFALECEGVPFAEFASDDFDFLFDGRALFGGKFPSKTFVPGTPSHFGLFATDLTKATVTAPADNSSDRLDIAVDAKIHYAEGGMSGYVPAANTAIRYRLFTSGKDYGLAGPISASNGMQLDYPLASKDFGGSFQPAYTPGASPAIQKTVGASGPSAGGDDPSVSISPTRFSAQIPLQIFGMDTDPQITATFILGRESGESYFLTVADIKLPPPGIALSPIPLSITGFRGGFGYHFDADTLAFADVDSQPNMGVTAAFSAGVSMGTTADDGFTLKGNATLSGDSSGNFQMDFTDWQLLSMGNFGGQLKYANKVFSGKLYGQLTLFDSFEAFKFMMGSGLGDAKVRFSFGQGDWYIYAGHKNDRIAIRSWGLNADGYLMLDKLGLQTGGRINTIIPPGADEAEFSVYVKSSIDIAAGILRKPSFHVFGDFAQKIGVGGCIPVFGCGEFSVTGKIHVEAPDPPKFQVCFEIDWPLDGEDAIPYCVGL